MVLGCQELFRRSLERPSKKAAHRALFFFSRSSRPGGQGSKKTRPTPPVFHPRPPAKNNRQTDGQSFRAGRAHRGYRENTEFYDFNRPVGLHLPPRRFRSRTPLLLRNKPGAARRRIAGHYSGGRPGLLDRPSNRRIGISAEGSSPGFDERKRAGRTLSHRVDVRHAFHRGNLQLLSPGLPGAEDDADAPYSGDVPFGVRRPSR